MPLGNETAKFALTLELQSRITRLAFRHRSGTSAPAPVPQPSHSFIKVSQMIQFIHQHYGETITATEIAANTGLKANYAIHLFKKLHGCGLIQYLTNIRMSAAQRELIMTNEKIINIAMDCEFNTLSRFYDAFKKRNDCSPAKYRKQNRPPISTL